MTTDDWRLRVVTRLPTAVLEAPAEVFVTVFALVFGPAQALDAVRSTSLSILFPAWFGRGYGVLLTVAGVTLLVGLRQGGTSPPAAAGLRLTAAAVGAYGVAVIGALGFGGIISGGMFLVIAALCALRAFIITTARASRAKIAQAAEDS